jgi:hypothetical protein
LGLASGVGFVAGCLREILSSSPSSTLIMTASGDRLTTLQSIQLGK